MISNEDELSRLFEDESTVRDLELKLKEFLSSTKIVEILRSNQLEDRLEFNLTLSIKSDDLEPASDPCTSDLSQAAFASSSLSGRCGYIFLNGVWIYICIP
jgi:hypothetical protein